METTTWEPPGKGPWELEATHFSRPFTHFVQPWFADGFARAWREGTARYGLLLERLQPAFCNSFAYIQPVAFGAPDGAMGPPPKPVLWLLTRLHPKIRARIAVSERAFADKQWRADLKAWDEVDKPAAVARHREIQAVDVSVLSDTDLIAHVAECAQHGADMVYLHHKYTITTIAVTGDFLAGALEWTGATPGDVLGLLRGTSRISNGFAATELDAAGKAIAADDAARGVLTSHEPATTVLSALSVDPSAGSDVRSYLDAVRYRSVGYDVGDDNAGELPEVLVGALRSAVEGTSATEDTIDLERLRGRVPAEHLDEFDDRFAEARLLNRLRDERGVYSDGWATGLARRALLEAGRRLTAAKRLHAAEHAVDLTDGEVAALLRGEAGPSADEVAARVAWRTTHTVADAPPFLRAMPGAPPPIGVLPPAARRAARAVDATLGNLFGVPETPNTDTVLHGLPVNEGVYEGTARLVGLADDFGRIQKGDVLVTRMTSPYFNVVLPLLGAIVTDRGGQLSHAAIVAREYGIPGIVGTREATAKITDGARVRVDGTTGEVRILG
ncbi:MAG: rifampicin phosphotransferase [Pseudonocardiales bacterium]|nr:rifampicin phosphotransferase [Pseudonocardiales bacterium]